jgi:urease accessory protein
VSAATPRAIRLLRVDEPHDEVSDTLILTSEQRRSQRASVVSVRGVAIDLDFPESIALRTDDVLVLDNGTFVDVIAAPEPLIEVRGEHAALARISWALGGRHVPVQFLPNRLRLRNDPTLVPLITAIGGKVAAIEAPFEPEGGAYAAHAHGHDDHSAHDHAHHDHDHHHDHHDHHRHSHKHGRRS